MDTVPRIVFCASSDITFPCLDYLQSNPAVHLCGILTQPSRAKGRGQVVSLNVVGQWAQQHSIPFYPADRMDEATLQWVSDLSPDAVLVMAFGHILPQRFLSIPPLGTWNLHVSLLPKYRGASPIQTALLNGDRETGVTFMRLVPKLDAGPYLLQETVSIEPQDTSITLGEKLAHKSAEILAKALPKLSPSVDCIPQVDGQATFCKKISKADGALDFNQPAVVLERQIRAFQPWPGSYFFKDGIRYKVLQAHLADATTRCVSGTFIVNAQRTALTIATADGYLAIDQIQKACERPMPIVDFLRGHPQF